MEAPQKSAVSCSEVSSLLGDFVENELPETLRRKLQAHFTCCSSCREFKASYIATIRISRSLSPVQMPKDARIRLRESLNRRLGLQLS